MSVPVLKQGDSLIATLQPDLSDSDLVELRAALARRVGEERCTGVVIDVTGVDVLDSFACRTLSELARTIRLRGADTVIVGIQPRVAFAMVQLGLGLGDVATRLDLDEGLDHLRSPRAGHVDGR